MDGGRERCQSKHLGYVSLNDLSLHFRSHHLSMTDILRRLEKNIAIIAATIPTIRPLFTQDARRKRDGNSDPSYHSRPANSNDTFRKIREIDTALHTTAVTPEGRSRLKGESDMIPLYDNYKSPEASCPTDSNLEGVKVDSDLV